MPERPGLSEIRPDQVDKVGKLFEDSVEDLTRLVRDGRHQLRMRPMAGDEVSLRAAEGFTQAGLASHVGALEQYRDRLRDIADGIRAGVAEYRRTETGNAEGMRRTEGV
ncbi:PE domain-containing protein [Kibdelosporangium persicum]|uniref:PE family protein n=1 Tax=Kibdelosporangium persicum TaxID=2698649 RepID=A0ABX2FAT2_9PSEU|nr:PE domain-containing protein [Kibdelosporangium persicum]NRN68392.1 hypothetical protein [Kibdelosporangium persicum]